MESTNYLKIKEMKKQYLIYLLITVLLAIVSSCKQTHQYKALIITGQNEHNWQVSSEAIKQILEETDMFSPVIMVAPAKGEDISGFNPDFNNYNLVVLDYKGNALSETVSTDLDDYVNNGGGLIYYCSKSDMVFSESDSVDITDRSDFEVNVIADNHPVLNELPKKWIQPEDVLEKTLKYDEDYEVLATGVIGSSYASFRDTSYVPTIEPVLLAKNSGKGRVLIIMFGAPDEKENNALHSVGFIITLQRGAEWVASGDVTQEVPYDFPTAAGATLRPDFKGINYSEALEKLGSYDITRSTKYYTFLQNEIRNAAGDENKLLKLEKDMVRILKGTQTTNEAKKLILRELSWMGSDYCIPVIESLESNPELSDNVEFALTRLQK